MISVVELPLAREVLVEAGHWAVIVPGVKHRVRPEGTVRFFVEFYQRADLRGSSEGPDL